MNPLSKFIEHLIKQRIYPFEKVIANGESHLFTDARSGKQYKYAIHEKDFRLIEIATKAAA